MKAGSAVIVGKETTRKGGERTRGKGTSRGGRRGGEGRLKKDGEDEKEEEKRGLKESARSNPCPEGNLDGELVG